LVAISHWIERGFGIRDDLPDLRIFGRQVQGLDPRARHEALANEDHNRLDMLRPENRLQQLLLSGKLLGRGTEEVGKRLSGEVGLLEGLVERAHPVQKAGRE
jgi:hypothetical protein